MDTEVIAAVIAGVFALGAAIAPLLIKKMQEKKGAEVAPPIPAEGLSAVIGVVHRGHEVLMVQRKVRIRHLSWQFPSGVAKPGVDRQDKVEQEIARETGVRCKVERFLGARVHEDTHVLCQYFVCAYLDGEAGNLDPEENAQVAWVRATAVKDYVTSDLFVEIEKVLDEIARQGPLSRVVLGVVRREGQVLLVKKTADNHGLPWQFPGGTVEPGELEPHAIVREVSEETGVQCSPVRRIGERVHPETRQPICYWLCDYVAGQATVREPERHSEVVWRTAAETIALLGESLFEPVREILTGSGQVQPPVRDG